MTSRTQRRIQRYVHLFAGLVIALYIYTPLGDEAAFRASVRLVSLPVLIVTGFGMWLLPKWQASRRRAAARSGT